VEKEKRKEKKKKKKKKRQAKKLIVSLSHSKNLPMPTTVRRCLALL
jgi:hypothetical protein